MCVISVSAQSGAASDVPDPLKFPEKCGRFNVSKSRICDSNLILSSQDKDIIEGLINDITTAEIAVVVILKMSSTYIGHDSPDEAARRFALQVHNQWGVGDSELENGIVLFLSIDDRSMYISVGAGISKKMPKNVIQIVISHMRPSLRAGMYGDAIQRAVLEIGLVLSGKLIVADNNEHAYLSFAGFVFFAFIAVCFCNRCSKGVSSSQQLKKGRKALRQLMTEVTNAKSHPGNSSSATCPICLDIYPPSVSLTPMEIYTPPPNPSTPSRSLWTIRSIGNARKQTEEVEGNPRRPMSLQCGHVFCYSCLKEYLMSKAQQGQVVCPICRQPVEGGQGRDIQRVGQRQGQGQGEERGRGESSAQRLQASRSRMMGLTDTQTEYSRIDDTDRYGSMTSTFDQDELLFRLMRISSLYPDTLPSDMHERMEDAVYKGSIREFEVAGHARLEEVARLLASEMEREALANSGGAGTSRGDDWGGGSSSGEGGGGSW